MSEPAAADASQPGQEPPPRVVQICTTINKWVGKVEAVLIVVALVALVSIGFYRSLYESTKKWWGKPVLWEPAMWSTPTILFLVFVIGMLGLALAAQSDKLINIDLFSRVLKPRVRMVIRIVGSLFAFLVSYYLIRSILHTRKVLDDHDSTGKLLSDHYAQLSIPITVGLTMLHLLLSAVSDAGWLLARRTPPAAHATTDADPAKDA